MEPLQVTLRRAKETKNTVRYEEPESDQPANDRHALPAEVGRPSPRRPGDDHRDHRGVVSEKEKGMSIVWSASVEGQQSW